MSELGVAAGAGQGALAGAAAGSVVPGLGTAAGAIAGGIIGLAGGLASEGSNDSYQKMLDAQLAYAKQREADARRAAAPTLAELRIQSQQMQFADRQLKRQEAILASVDPSIIEAGKQILQIQQGHNTRIIQPFLAQRAEQRGRIIASLQASQGPGAAQGSAGIDALRKFDSDTALQTQALQNQSLNSLLGVMTGAAGVSNSASNEASTSLNSAFNTSNTLQQRMINAITGVGYGNIAGNQYRGGISSGAQDANALEGLLKAGGAYANSAKPSNVPFDAPSANSLLLPQIGDSQTSAPAPNYNLGSTDLTGSFGSYVNPYQPKNPLGLGVNTDLGKPEL